MKAWRVVGEIAAIAVFVAGAFVVADETSRHMGPPPNVSAISSVPKPANAPLSTPALVATSAHHRSNAAPAHGHRPGRVVPLAQVTPAPESLDRPGVAGAVVAIDPKTGKMVMPSPEQMQRLTASAQQTTVSRSPEGLIETHYPNGMVVIDLQGRFQDYATVRIRPGGTKEFHCVTDTSADAMARAAEAERDGATPEGTARRGAGAPKEER